MHISPISRSYWRLIKEGTKKSGEIIGHDKKEQVEYLAMEDVEIGKVTKERYVELMGTPCPENLVDA